MIYFIFTKKILSNDKWNCPSVREEKKGNIVHLESVCVNASGDVPEVPSGRTHYICIYANGTWDALDNNNQAGFICEWTGTDTYVVYFRLLCIKLSNLFFILLLQRFRILYHGIVSTVLHTIDECCLNLNYKIKTTSVDLLILPSLLAECGPGLYKVTVTTSNNRCRYVSLYVFEKDECRPCPDCKIKSVSGDDEALCDDVCDGTTNVPNVARTACGE